MQTCHKAAHVFDNADTKIHICITGQQQEVNYIEMGTAQIAAIRYSIRTDGSTAAEKRNSVQEQEMTDTDEGLK